MLLLFGYNFEQVNTSLYLFYSASYAKHTSRMKIIDKNKFAKEINRIIGLIIRKAV